VNILPFVVIDQYADDLDVVEELMEENNGGVVQVSDIIEGTYLPLETYPANHHTVAFHRVWLIATRVFPEGKRSFPYYLLHLRYKVSSQINSLVRTQIEIKCVKDHSQWFRMCYRYELKFDTHVVEGNLTKMAFEKALIEFQEDEVPPSAVTS
jgi:hypothetical protein